MSFVISMFINCYRAIREGKLIQRESRRDKEYHFQEGTPVSLHIGGKTSF